MKKEKATQKSSPKKSGRNGNTGRSGKRKALHDTARKAQQNRALLRLQKGPADTFVLRREENILMPAARIKELKEQGYDILSQRITLVDEYGREHRGIALYSLIGSGKQSRASA